ncbi:hypothetical protein [Kitasatospora aureofaciens]|uniref:hypothetical protein n=1 Tax=Kitasatospora aureofaciens TaxID=1894 RepID=UPI0033E8AB0D
MRVQPILGAVLASAALAITGAAGATTAQAAPDHHATAGTTHHWQQPTPEREIIIRQQQEQSFVVSSPWGPWEVESVQHQELSVSACGLICAPSP